MGIDKRIIMPVLLVAAAMTTLFGDTEAKPLLRKEDFDRSSEPRIVLGPSPLDIQTAISQCENEGMRLLTVEELRYLLSIGPELHSNFKGSGPVWLAIPEEGSTTPALPDGAIQVVVYEPDFTKENGFGDIRNPNSAQERALSLCITENYGLDNMPKQIEG